MAQSYFNSSFDLASERPPHSPATERQLTHPSDWREPVLEVVPVRLGPPVGEGRGANGHKAAQGDITPVSHVADDHTLRDRRPFWVWVEENRDQWAQGVAFSIRGTAHTPFCFCHSPFPPPGNEIKVFPSTNLPAPLSHEKNPARPPSCPPSREPGEVQSGVRARKTDCGAQSKPDCRNGVLLQQERAAFLS